jgi:hypothetical protein
MPVDQSRILPCFQIRSVHNVQGIATAHDRIVAPPKTKIPRQ